MLVGREIFHFLLGKSRDYWRRAGFDLGSHRMNRIWVTGLALPIEGAVGMQLETEATILLRVLGKVEGLMLVQLAEVSILLSACNNDGRLLPTHCAECNSNVHREHMCRLKTVHGKL